MSDKQLFFPHLDFYLKVTGRPTGTGMLERVASNLGKELPIKGKTLRKVLGFGKVRQSVSDRWQAYVEGLLGKDQLQTFMGSLPEDEMLKTQLKWYSHFKGAELADSETMKVSFKTAYQLLDSEILLANLMRDKHLSFAEKMLLLLQSDYTKYLLPGDFIPDELIRRLKKADRELHPKELLALDKSYRLFMPSGVISLLLCLAAAMEVDNQVLIDGGIQPNSWGKSLLPSTQDGEVVYPLGKLLREWKETLGGRSIEMMAQYAPATQAADTQDRKRLLNYWMNGKHTPDEMADWDIAIWIEQFSGKAAESELVRKEVFRFLMACYFQRLFKLSIKYGQVTEPSLLIPAFELYEYHYKNVLSDSVLKVS